MSYCDGLCPHLNDRTHTCKLTKKKLIQLKGWWGTTHEHTGFCEHDKQNRERINRMLNERKQDSNEQR